MVRRSTRAVIPNGDKIRELREKRNWSQDRLFREIIKSNPPPLHSDRDSITLRTIQKAESSAPIDRTTLDKIANGLKIDWQLLINTDDPEYKTAPDGRIREWVIEATEPERTASNGLIYVIHRLRNNIGRLDRGKCYNTCFLKKADREKISDQYFNRHAQVCSLLIREKNIPINHSVFQDGPFWWVIDEWIEGEKLDAMLNRGPLGGKNLIIVMKGIAAGLQALHKTQIIRRELSPRFIIIRKDTYEPVLTEFELAKLLDGSQTVSNSDWQKDFYRAPEVGTRQELTGRADLFSWSAILAHAATGKMAKNIEEWPDILQIAPVPESIKNIALKCLELDPQKRPKDIGEVIRAIR